MKGLNLRLCLQNMTLQNSGYAEYLYATHARGAAVGGDDLKKFFIILNYLPIV